MDSQVIAEKVKSDPRVVAALVRLQDAYRAEQEILDAFNKSNEILKLVGIDTYSARPSEFPGYKEAGSEVSNASFNYKQVAKEVTAEYMQCEQ